MAAEEGPDSVTEITERSWLQRIGQSVAGVLFGFALIAGGAIGPFVTGLLHDWTGTYTIAWSLGVAFSMVCAVCVWIAAPRKVRVVAGSLR